MTIGRTVLWCTLLALLLTLLLIYLGTFNALTSERDSFKTRVELCEQNLESTRTSLIFVNVSQGITEVGGCYQFYYEDASLYFNRTLTQEELLGKIKVMTDTDRSHFNASFYLHGVGCV